MTSANDVLRKALALAPTDPEGALAIVADALAHAAELPQQAASSLAKHAGVICTSLNRYHEAIGYYEAALRHPPDDGYLSVAIGDLYRRVGEPGRARLSLQLSLRIATEHADAELSSLVEKALGELE